LRRHVVRLITFVGGLYFLVEFVLPAEAPAWVGGFENPLTKYRPVVTNFVVVVATMAFLLGPLNLVRSHVTRIFRKRKGWLESSVFLLFLATAVVATSMRTRESDAAGAAKAAGKKREAASQSTQPRHPSSGPSAVSAPAEPPRREGKTFFDVLHHALVFGITTAFFASSMALLAFYLISAAHRAFRMSNLESGLMMAAAVVVLLGQVPVGDWITHSLPEPFQLRSAAQWILLVPNAGVQRAVLIGACGGAIAAGLRHWLGLGRRSE
jgi:hypothetical protein